MKLATEYKPGEYKIIIEGGHDKEAGIDDHIKRKPVQVLPTRIRNQHNNVEANTFH